MRERFSRGLVVGKFCPLHLGHESVIRRALDCCDEVFVLSYTRPEFPGCEPEKRREWLAVRFPTVRSLVLETQDSIPSNEADDTTHRQFTARICRERFGTSVDAVFTSEAYGDGFAGELAQQFGHAVTNVMVDAARAAVPISGTRLREDIHSNRRFLAPEVYASFVRRVAILGGESSGKTTLAAALARHFDTVWVAEFGRELWEQKSGHLQLADMEMIVEEQIAREGRALHHAHRFVFCDTTPLTTHFYSEVLFGTVSPEVSAAAFRSYDFTVLCEPDFPFVQDGTRRDDAFRHTQHAWYEERLFSMRVPIFRASGLLEERIQSASTRLACAQDLAHGGARLAP